MRIIMIIRSTFVHQFCVDFQDTISFTVTIQIARHASNAKVA